MVSHEDFAEYGSSSSSSRQVNDDKENSVGVHDAVKTKETKAWKPEHSE